MTKVQLDYNLARPLDDQILQAIARAHGIYGIVRVRLNAAMDGLTVEYDASRLTARQVEAALHSAGIPIARFV